MRKTLLEMVQLILSSLDSDEVNSISDTIESGQVTSIIESCYYDMITDIAMPEHGTAFQLNPSNTPSRPTLMTVPQNVTNLEEVRYDHKKTGDLYSDYHIIQYKPFNDFIVDQGALNSDGSSTGEMSVTFNNESFKVLYRNNKMPQFYTTIDDNTLIFDSYDNTEDSTLQKIKTLCIGTVYPAFLKQDTFSPLLDPTQFSLLINKAKTRAFNELKQQINQESAAEARRQKIIVQKRKQKTPNLPEVYKVARFGRK